MDPALFASLPQIGELAAQWPNDSWEAVKQLEAALESVRQGVELQLQEIETDTSNLEELCEDMRMQVAGMSPEVEGLESMRSLLVCYFPREANKEIVLVDKRNEKWCVKAEWTKSADIPKKPKKKRSKKGAQQDYFGSPQRDDFL